MKKNSWQLCFGAGVKKNKIKKSRELKKKYINN